MAQGYNNPHGMDSFIKLHEFRSCAEQTHILLDTLCLKTDIIWIGLISYFNIITFICVLGEIQIYL